MMTGISNGPHKGREIELLLAGSKPVALFTTMPCAKWQERSRPLDEAVARGQLLKREVFSWTTPRIFYSQPSESAAMEELIAIYQRIDEAARKNNFCIRISLPDHRRIGELLGYSWEDVDLFIQEQRIRNARANHAPPLPG